MVEVIDMLLNKFLLLFLLILLLKCVNKNEEIHKFQVENSLCNFFSKELTQNRSDQLLGTIYCATILRNKIAKLRERDYFKLDDN